MVVWHTSNQGQDGADFAIKSCISVKIYVFFKGALNIILKEPCVKDNAWFYWNFMKLKF